MFTSWTKPSARCGPLSVTPLEDRTVPTVFFVDPTFANNADGDLVNFNTGKDNALPGMTYGTSLAYYQANPSTVIAFSDLSVALDVAEANPGTDSIVLADGVIPLTNPTATAAMANLNQGSEKNVTQQLTIVGSGSGASVVRPTNDTTFDGMADQFTALIRVGSGGNFTGADFRLDGSGFQTGAGFVVADGANAIFQRVAVSGTMFDANTGAAIVVQNGAQAIVDRSDLSNYGRNGVFVSNADATVFESAVTGRGAGAFINNGVEASGASTVLVTGSVITNNTGRTGGFESAGVLAENDLNVASKVATVTLVGNRIAGNAIGAIVGASTGDGSTLVANYNNFVANGVAVDATLATVKVNATTNYFNSPSGPFQAVGNPGGRGNSVTPSANVNYSPYLLSPTSVLGAFAIPGIDSQTGYLAATSSTGVVVNALSPQLAPPTGSVTFEAVFTGLANPTVVGFAADDLVLSSASGASLTATVTADPNRSSRYVITVTGAFNPRDLVAIYVKPTAALIAGSGGNDTAFFNAVSNLATIAIG